MFLLTFPIFPTMVQSLEYVLWKQRVIASRKIMEIRDGENNLFILKVLLENTMQVTLEHHPMV